MSPGEGRGPLDFDEDEGGWEEPEQERPAPPAPQRGLGQGRSAYVWIVGIAAVVAIAAVTLNSLRSEGPGSRGVPAGTKLPPFAMPLAASGLEGDANIATESGQGQRGQRPACAVRGREILNLCELAEKGPVVLAFLAARSEECVDQLDVLSQVARSHPRVQFAAVAVKGDRDELRRLVRSRGWAFPVGYDRDGAVSSLYGIAVCPTITLARGSEPVAVRTLLGKVQREQLERAVSQLERSAAA